MIIYSEPNVNGLSYNEAAVERVPPVPDTNLRLSMTLFIFCSCAFETFVSSVVVPYSEY